MVLSVIYTIGNSVVCAQEMKKGMSLFNTGFGFVPGVCLNVSYDYGIVNECGPGIFTIGGYAGIANWGKTHSDKSHHHNYRVTAFAFAPRTTYRYPINQSFEVYATAMFGTRIVFSSSSEYADFNEVFFSTTAGCRYSFGAHIAIFAEIGINKMSLLNGGLSFSF